MLAERLPVQNTSSIQTVELPPDNDSSETKFPQADARETPARKPTGYRDTFPWERVSHMER
jgi:hypothetical protein